MVHIHSWAHAGCPSRFCLYPREISQQVVLKGRGKWHMNNVSSHFVTWANGLSFKIQLSYHSSGKHSRNSHLPCCEWGAPHLCPTGPGCPPSHFLACSICDFCLCISCTSSEYWIKGILFTLFCPPGAWELFTCTCRKRQHSLFCYNNGEAVSRNKGEILCILENKFLASFVGSFIFLFWCQYYFNEVVPFSLSPFLLFLHPSLHPF